MKVTEEGRKDEQGGGEQLGTKAGTTGTLTPSFSLVYSSAHSTVHLCGNEQQQQHLPHRYTAAITIAAATAVATAT